MADSSQKIIDSLHPLIRKDAAAILKECNAALKGRAKVRFNYGLRTEKEQNDLYALGRTVVNPDGKSKSKPKGNIVTNAKAWQSIHNYGLALDMVLFVDNKSYKWDSSTDFDGDGVADWKECVKIFKAHGWEWGGDWASLKDEPHFQYDFGYTWQTLRSMREVGRIIPGTIYVDVARTPIVDPTILRTAASVNLRTGPGTNHSIIQVLLKGETVKELSKADGWSKVVYGSKTGYVSNQYLIKVSA